MDMNRWPQWIRWLLFLPAAGVAAIILPWLSGIFTPRDFAQGIAYDLFQSVLTGAVFVGAGSYVAPRNRLAVALVLGSIIIFFGGWVVMTAVTNPYVLSRPPFQVLVIEGGMIAGAGGAAWQVIKLGKEADDAGPTA